MALAPDLGNFAKLSKPQQPPKEAEAQTAKIELVYQERLSQMELMVVDWG